MWGMFAGKPPMIKNNSTMNYIEKTICLNKYNIKLVVRCCR